jgi:3-hydroxybutyryl-CoA dehydratase
MDSIARRTGLDPADLTGFYFEDLFVGMKGIYARTITETDIVMFAGISGDTNPMHLNEEYAKATPFGGRIAHGMLSACFITTVLGTRLPGPGCIYMSQNLRFRSPVRIGETVTTTVTVTGLVPEKRRAMLSTICTVGDRIVIDGEAMVMVPARAAISETTA